MAAAAVTMLVGPTAYEDQQRATCRELPYSLVIRASSGPPRPR
jgi:hypothetical protein